MIATVVILKRLPFYALSRSKSNRIDALVSGCRRVLFQLFADGHANL
jgi:hypothetical protein